MIDAVDFGSIQVDADHGKSLVNHLHCKGKADVTEADNAKYRFFIFDRIQ